MGREQDNIFKYGKTSSPCETGVSAPKDFRIMEAIKLSKNISEPVIVFLSLDPSVVENHPY